MRHWDRESLVRVSHLFGSVTCSGQSLVRVSHLFGSVTCSGQSLVRVSHLFGSVSCSGQSLVRVGLLFWSVTCSGQSLVRISSRWKDTKERGGCLQVRVVDWNSVEEATLRSVDGPEGESEKERETGIETGNEGGRERREGESAAWTVWLALRTRQVLPSLQRCCFGRHCRGTTGTAMALRVPLRTAASRRTGRRFRVARGFSAHQRHIPQCILTHTHTINTHTHTHTHTHTLTVRGFFGFSLAVGPGLQRQSLHSSLPI